MRYESLSYDELERLHTADPNNVSIAFAMAAAAKHRVLILEVQIMLMRGDAERLEAEIRDFKDE